jgi:hypothetical protein
LCIEISLIESSRMSRITNHGRLFVREGPNAGLGDQEVGARRRKLSYVQRMNRRTKVAGAWAVAVRIAIHSLDGCSTNACAVSCPAGTIPDSTGCGCIQAGPTCNPTGPEAVQDGGAVLGNCCPRDVLQSTSRVAPTGVCSGSFQCFVAVHQVCSEPAGPVDQYVCTCEGSSWQCSRTMTGSGICAAADADTVND